MSDEIPFQRPSRLSYFWWRNYFSENPASVFSKDEKVFYSRDGYIQAHPNYRSDPFWTSDATCWYLCCHDIYLRPMYFGSGVSSGSKNSDGDGAAIVILVILALVALVIACALVFQFPPIMIFSWVVLVISSVSETIVDGTSVCMDFRWINLVSAGWIVILLVGVISAIFQMQRLYNHYYPGTPDVKVDVVGLIQFFKAYTNFYWFTLLPSTGLMVWCIVDIATSFKEGNICPWTFFTMCSWAVVHFLNMVAGLAMATRMNNKFELLSEPPQYEFLPVNHPQPPSLIAFPPPTYSPIMDPTQSIVEKNPDMLKNV